MSSIKKVYLFFLLAFCQLFILAGLQAQDTIAIGTPGQYVGPNNLHLIEVALTILLSYITGFVPGLAKFKGYIRSASVALLITGSAVIFKLGAINQEAIILIFATYFPTVTYSGFFWETLKWLLGRVGIDIQPPKPAAITADTIGDTRS